MPRIRFNGPAYEARSKDANAQKCINWYPEKDTREGKNDRFYLMPTPGLTSFSAVEGVDSVVRGLFEHQGTLYAVVGSTFYSIDSEGTATSEGTLSSSTGLVQIAGVDDGIVIVDGTAGYRYVPSTDSFTTISDSDFPSTVKTITSQDGYFITHEPNTQKFRISNLNDGATWDTLDFASAEGSFDEIVACVSDNRQLWIFGETTTEVWINTGASAFPFERIQDVFLDWGLAAERSVVKLDNTLYWLAKSKNGSGAIVKANGFTAQIVSTPAIMNKINSYDTIDDAFGYSYQLQGHEFYVLTFPTEGATWVYDASTGLWHERTSFLDNEYTRHRSNCYAFAYNKHFIGDFATGTIYELDPDVYTEDGTAIRRVRVTQHTHKDTKLLTMRNLVVDVESGPGLQTGQGSDPQYMLRVSRDGGRTWGNERWRSPGKAGIYDARMIWNLLGIARTFTMELSITDPVNAIIIGAHAEIETGSN